MITALTTIHEIAHHTRTTPGFTAGELSMLLDIFNSTMLTPHVLDRDTLDLQVTDSFDLYPGTYEDKWATDKTAMLGKIAQLTDLQAAAFQIWAVDFWRSGCYEGADAINNYITGKTSAGHKLIDAYRHTQEAITRQDQFKGTGVKSKLIAEARTETAKAAEILEKLID